VTFPHTGPSERLVLRPPYARLRSCPCNLVDRIDPGTCGGIDVGWAVPEAVKVRFDNEVASAPVVGHLCAVAFGPEEPGLVAEPCDLLVLGNASDLLAQPRE
jgi:hypothetical protein